MRVYSAKDYPHKELTERVIGSAIEVHRSLGPGFLEDIYERAMLVELRHAGLNVKQQQVFPIWYREVQVGNHRADLVVEERVLVELKAVEKLHPKHAAQVKSTLKAASLEVGLLINFNEAILTDGIKRIVLTRGTSR
ncbi:MAG: GxxExxY protein [Phycisphaerae bacterium]|nr:GxxExxY protein [Phycisphaerae bacterium]